MPVPDDAFDLIEDGGGDGVTGTDWFLRSMCAVLGRRSDVRTEGGGPGGGEGDILWDTLVLSVFVGRNRGRRSSGLCVGLDSLVEPSVDEVEGIEGGAEDVGGRAWF